MRRLMKEYGWLIPPVLAVVALSVFLMAKF